MPEEQRHSVESFIGELLRFGLLATGDLDQAGELVKKSIESAHSSAGDLRDQEAWKIWLFRHLHRELLKLSPSGKSDHSILDESVDDSTLPDIEALTPEEMVMFFQSLPQPCRNAYALFNVNCFAPEGLLKALDMNRDRLAVELQNGRIALSTWMKENRSNNAG